MPFYDWWSSSDWWPHIWFPWFPFPIVFMVIGIIFCIFMMSMMMGMMGQRHRGRDEPFASKTSLDILDERYARGEINQSEYAEKRRTILQAR